MLQRCLNQLLVNLITKAHESDSVSRVSEIAPELPSDIEALHVLLAAARAERDAAIAEAHRGAGGPASPFDSGAGETPGSRKYVERMLVRDNAAAA